MTPATLTIILDANDAKEYAKAQRALRRYQRRALWYQWRPFVGRLAIVAALAAGGYLLAVMVILGAK
jgi:hypothetical protein